MVPYGRAVGVKRGTPFPSELEQRQGGCRFEKFETSIYFPLRSPPYAKMITRFTGKVYMLYFGIYEFFLFILWY